MSIIDNTNIARILRLAILDPAAAADELDLLAAKLIKTAKELRAIEKTADNDYIAPGGMTDIVKVSVVGPDGIEKQRVTARG